jgi:hypothetical protein
MLKLSWIRINYLGVGVWDLVRMKLGQKEKLRFPKAFQQTTTTN